MLTLPVVRDQTLRVLSSEPLTIRFPENWRQVITWSSWPFSSFGVRIGFVLQFISIACWRMYSACEETQKQKMNVEWPMNNCFNNLSWTFLVLTFQGEILLPIFLRLWWLTSRSSLIPSALHFSLHNKLSSAKKRQLRQVWAARRRSFGSKKLNTYKASFNEKNKSVKTIKTLHLQYNKKVYVGIKQHTSLGRREIKSLWNCGSITSNICLTCIGSQVSISRSIAISLSAFRQCYNIGKKNARN